jgi:FkbM family methyltransferase
LLSAGPQEGAAPGRFIDVTALPGGGVGTRAPVFSLTFNLVRVAHRLGLELTTRTGNLRTAARRAHLVDHPWRFLIRELRGRPVVADYRLRESGTALTVRHATEDTAIFDEVFERRLYEPPAEVVAALRGAGSPGVVDLGGNVGYFGAYVAGRFPGARVTFFEPDPENADQLERFIGLNAMGGRWKLHRACALDRDGEIAFAAGRFSESRIDEGAEGALRVPGLDVFDHLDGVDLLKIDIEGGEWAILGDERFRDVSARALALEYHPHLCPGPDPRAEATRLLSAAGYRTKTVFHDPRGIGMVWAWR